MGSQGAGKNAAGKNATGKNAAGKNAAGKNAAGKTGVGETGVSGNALSAADAGALLRGLKARFEQNPARHRGLVWSTVEARLGAHPDKLTALQGMEQTGGEPDVIDHDPRTAELLFCDCSAESPAGRRSLCYDGEALASRKENKPAGAAIDLAARLGIALLTEEQYRKLQQLGEFDSKTSSWVKTPAEVRGLGGALFGDRRYDKVFVYHNGASSYYAARGFRGVLRV